MPVPTQEYLVNYKNMQREGLYSRQFGEIKIHKSVDTSMGFGGRKTQRLITNNKY